MLREVLQAIESADGAVHIGELSQRLGIERSCATATMQMAVQLPVTVVVPAQARLPVTL